MNTNPASDVKPDSVQKSDNVQKSERIPKPDSIVASVRPLVTVAPSDSIVASVRPLVTVAPSDSIVASVVSSFQQRSEIGIKKYGVTLDRTDLGLLDWVQHTQEELMDAVLYLEKLKKTLMLTS